MRRRVSAASAALALLVSCGARTGLDVEPAAERPDAGRRDTGPVVVVPALTVVLTADNAYRFGFGSERALRSMFGAAEATSAGQIFNCSEPCTGGRACSISGCGPAGACEDGEGPEIYVVPEGAATGEDFLYVVAWSDDSVTQGLLGEIRTPDGRVVRTGEPGWEVCATGVDYDRGGPGDGEVNTWLGRCASRGGPSGGWVGVTMAGPSLAIGETNAGSDGDFPETCIDPSFGDHLSRETRWIWMTPRAGEGGAFTTPAPEFLIFRLPTRAIVER
jgi:hypothetical protein